MLSGHQAFEDVLNLFSLKDKFREDPTLRPQVAGLIPQTNVFEIRLVNLMKQCWSQDPVDRPTFAKIVAALDPLKREVEALIPLPLFWESSRRLRMILDVGNILAPEAIGNYKELVTALAAGESHITGGDWTAALKQSLLVVLDGNVSNERRRGVVHLIRALSNIYRHIEEHPNSKDDTPFLDTYVDQCYPELAMHIFRVLLVHCPTKIPH